MNPLQRPPVALLLAVVAIAGLGYDAYVHLDLAPVYDNVKDDLTQGTLFRVEAATAIVAALGLLLWDTRPAWLLAGAVGLGGVVAVVLYRYVDVPSLGPVPRMYEPVWYAEKTWSAVAEGAVALAAVAREVLRRASLSAASAGG